MDPLTSRLLQRMMRNHADKKSAFLIPEAALVPHPGCFDSSCKIQSSTSCSYSGGGPVPKSRGGGGTDVQKGLLVCAEGLGVRVVEAGVSLFVLA